MEHPFRNSLAPYSACSAAALLLLSSCGGSGYVRVDEVYISKQSPALEKAAREMSTAQKESLGDAASARLQDLRVEVDAASGLGPEEFRILVGDAEVRVQGGGTSGALYGGLEAAERMRRGLSGPGLAIARATPRFERRILRSGISLPGLSERPDPLDADALFDALARGRFNTLAVACRSPFARLVRLARFPKAAGAAGPTTAPGELNAFLARAESSGVNLLVTPLTLEIPDAFFQNYGARPEERSSASALGRSYLRECIVELLRAHPRIAGVGISGETLRAAPGSPPEEIARAVFLDGIRASGRKAYLFVHLSAAESLKGLAAPQDIEVLREVEAPATLLGPRPGDAVPARSTCVSIPRHEILPSPPTAARTAVLMRRAASSFPAAFVLDGFDSRSAATRGSHRLARESFLTGVIGLSAWDPGLDDGAWSALWPDLDSSAVPALVEALAGLEGAWTELALHHRGSPEWSPLFPEDAHRAPGAMRDSRPLLGLLELIFTRSRDPAHLTIPESVALEVRGQTAGSTGAHALETARVILERANASLASLEPILAGAGGDSPVDAARRLALEIEGLSRIAICQGKRIRAGVFLLRHAAGIGKGAREEARKEIVEATREIAQAAEALGAIRDDDPHGLVPHGLASWRAALEEDGRAIAAALSDPGGFRATPLLEARIPLATSFDFEAVRGFLHLGHGLLDNPPLALTEDSQLFEAEDMVGSWQSLRDIPGFSGTGYLSSGAQGAPSGGGPVLRIRLERAGTFQVWTRAVEGRGESCTLRLRVQGVLLQPTHDSGAGARRLEWRKAGQVALAPGEAFLQVIDDGAGREGIDAIVLTRDAQWIPPES